MQVERRVCLIANCILQISGGVENGGHFVVACAVRNVLFGRYLARVRWLGVAKLEAEGSKANGKGVVKSHHAPPYETPTSSQD